MKFKIGDRVQYGSVQTFGIAYGYIVGFSNFKNYKVKWDKYPSDIFNHFGSELLSISPNPLDIFQQLIHNR